MSDITTPSADGRITRAQWDDLPTDYKAGRPEDGTAQILMNVPPVGTCLVPVKVDTHVGFIVVGQYDGAPKGGAICDINGRRIFATLQSARMEMSFYLHAYPDQRYVICRLEVVGDA